MKAAPAPAVKASQPKFAPIPGASIPQKPVGPGVAAASAETSDLVATILSTSTSPLVAGQPYHTRWEVANRGTDTAAGTFYTYYYVDNKALASWYVTDLPPGYYAWAEVDLTHPTGGNFEPKIQTDTTGVIAESNESNNTLAYTWTWQWPNPPWADNYHYFWALDADPWYTRDAALPAQSRQAEVGYSAAAHLNSTKADIAGRMQTDAVWSIYTHGVAAGVSPDRVTVWNDILTKQDILGYNLIGMRVAVFYACRAASNGNDNITNAAVQAGAGASLGFSDEVYIAGDIPNHFDTGPAYTWSKHFWHAMADGNTILDAARFARDEFFRERQDFGNVDKFVIYGSQSMHITPPGYQ